MYIGNISMAPPKANELFNKTLRRWTVVLEKLLGFRLEPQSIIVIAILVILLLISIAYTLFTTTFLYCQLPNMRISFLRSSMPSYDKLNTIYVVTPTYDRYVQKAELVRLSHTFMLVPNLHWIIVEDSERSTQMISKFVHRLKAEYDFFTVTHLHEKTPERYKLKPNEPTWKHPKGVWQRNRALDWLENYALDLDEDGVIYFADDDNTYDLEIFNEMRSTKRISVWPVGFVGGLLVERPIVDTSGKIISFNSMWRSERPFPLDMAGFSISSRLFKTNSKARFSADQRVGYLESNFLSQFVKSWEELEPKADMCTKVLVWHTKTQAPALHEERKLTRPSHIDLEW